MVNYKLLFYLHGATIKKEVQNRMKNRIRRLDIKGIK